MTEERIAGIRGRDWHAEVVRWLESCSTTRDAYFTFGPVEASDLLDEYEQIEAERDAAIESRDWLAAEVERLRAVVEHYADENTWGSWPLNPEWPRDWYNPGPGDPNGYDVARAVLGSPATEAGE